VFGLAIADPPAAQVLVILHPTVIDVTGAQAVPDQAVIIIGERITNIANAGTIELPINARILDATGKFLIPGLWDMHVHTLGKGWPESSFRAFIQNGVTGVRDMGSPLAALDDVDRFRKQIEAGSLVGPRLVVAGPVVDGPMPMFPELSIAVSSPFEARQAVKELQARGADFIKVYSLLPRDAYFAIANEAKRRDISFSGHVPESISALEASDAGQKSIEHLSGVRLACSTREPELRKELIDARAKADAALLYRVLRNAYARSRETYDENKAQFLFARFVENDTWQVPTLVVSRFVAQVNKNRNQRVGLASDSVELRRDPCVNNFTSDEFELIGAAADNAFDLVGKMRRAGIKFMAGTDTPNPFVNPGQSLHDELELLVHAGFTPKEVLQSATRNPAEYLGLLDILGTVEKGKAADLILLDANPLEDIKNTRKIWAVISRGRLFEKASID